MASFNSELRLFRQSWAAPRCSPIAASSSVRPHIVATEPTTNSAAVTGSLPITLRLFPRYGDNNIVAVARTNTIVPVMAIPVLNMTRRSLGSTDSISARRSKGTPTAPTVASRIPVDAAAAARPTSRALKRWVATAQ